MTKKLFTALLTCSLLFISTACSNQGETNNLSSSIGMESTSTTSVLTTTVTKNTPLSASTSITTKHKTTTLQTNISSRTENKTTTTNNATSTAPGTYTVTFDLGYDNKQFKLQSSNFKVVEPKKPIREGYNFTGWMFEDERWVFNGYAVTQDMTLTAEWRKYVYYINYEIDTTSLRQDNIILKLNVKDYVIEDKYTQMYMPTSTTLNYTTKADTSIITFDAPECYTVDSETFTVGSLSIPGYTFHGWSYEGQQTPVKTVTIPKGSTQDYHLKAHLEKNK